MYCTCIVQSYTQCIKFTICLSKNSVPSVILYFECLELIQLIRLICFRKMLYNRVDITRYMEVFTNTLLYCIVPAPSSIRFQLICVDRRCDSRYKSFLLPIVLDRINLFKHLSCWKEVKVVFAETE